MLIMQRAIVALGGNALIKNNQKGTIYEQFANTREFSETLVKMIQENMKIVLTHGNGPQVGAILLQNNKARDIVPSMPLGICVAESQGLIGYMIQQCLYNAFTKAHITKPVISLITQVLVDERDPTMKNPTKPIGPYYTEDESQHLLKQGYQITKQPQGWRIVVPSPDPIKIIEGDIIKSLMENDIFVIAAGGGGLPVIKKENWGLDGVEAVVDKDLASERLAEAIHADLFMILTNVEKVSLFYNTNKQKDLDDCSLSEIKKYYEQGHFPPGSMGPKILSAIRFLQTGGKKVIITDINNGYYALKGKTGTHITNK
jgi:carbamate kinase